MRQREVDDVALAHVARPEQRREHGEVRARVFVIYPSVLAAVVFFFLFRLNEIMGGRYAVLVNVFGGTYESVLPSRRASGSPDLKPCRCEGRIVGYLI